MSDTIMVMNKGYIQQIGTRGYIQRAKECFCCRLHWRKQYNSATMVEDRLVNILGTNYQCVDTGFGKNVPVDVVIRPGI